MEKKVLTPFILVFLCCVLDVLPYYGLMYRVILNKSGSLLLFGGIIYYLGLFLFIKSKKLYLKALAVWLGMWMFLILLSPIGLLQKVITEGVLSQYYCGKDSKGTVLGGLHRISGGYMSEDHCELTVCNEYLFSCPRR